MDGLIAAATEPKAQIVVTAVVGMIGIRPTIAAMEAGKDVMCEKPMAKNYAEAQKMVETAEKTGRVLNIGYQNRYRSDSLYLKRNSARADRTGKKSYFDESSRTQKKSSSYLGCILK